MTIKLKYELVAKANSDRIRAYLLSKRLRGKDCTDAEIQTIYKMSDTDFKAATAVLVADGSVEEV